MTHDAMKACFNEWMRRYTEDPDAFSAEFVSIKEFLSETLEGRDPSYGDICAAYMAELQGELDSAPAGAGA